jgi:pyruvate formate lyase activating enzyme
MRRREFIRTLGVGTCGMLGSGLIVPAAVAQDDRFRKEALYYEKLKDERVRCLLCPRECVVDDVERGYCGVRENTGGTYHTIVYGRVCTYQIDPIEKKPLFHFLPGTNAFSISTVGCNMECKFCQNWETSQERPENVDALYLPPESLVETAKRYNCPTVAYTYTEPTVFYEYMLDSAVEGRSRGMRNVVITAAYIQRDPLLKLAAQVDAIKIDLKSYSDDFYKRICSSSLQPVLDSIVTVRGTGTWLEIVYLVIPTLNDDEGEIDLMCKWLLDNVGDEVPIHFTRFHPTYRLKNLPPTPLPSVERARDVALARGLKYVYVGNVPAGHPGQSTYCPGCGRAVVKRAGYMVLSFDLVKGKCPDCGTTIPGVWI